ncbi:MAG: hypothetical protein ABIJ72_00165 [bacterium]
MKIVSFSPAEMIITGIIIAILFFSSIDLVINLSKNDAVLENEKTVSECSASLTEVISNEFNSSGKVYGATIENDKPNLINLDENATGGRGFSAFAILAKQNGRDYLKIFHKKLVSGNRASYYYYIYQLPNGSGDNFDQSALKNIKKIGESDLLGSSCYAGVSDNGKEEPFSLQIGSKYQNESKAVVLRLRDSIYLNNNQSVFSDINIMEVK